MIMNNEREPIPSRFYVVKMFVLIQIISEISKEDIQAYIDCGKQEQYAKYTSLIVSRHLMGGFSVWKRWTTGLDRPWTI